MVSSKNGCVSISKGERSKKAALGAMPMGTKLGVLMKLRKPEFAFLFFSL
jgi:hypothetical protein